MLTRMDTDYDLYILFQHLNPHHQQAIQSVILDFDLMSDAQIKAQMDLWVLNGTLPRSINAVNMNKRLRATGKNLFDTVGMPIRNSHIIKLQSNSIKFQSTINLAAMMW